MQYSLGLNASSWRAVAIITTSGNALLGLPVTAAWKALTQYPQNPQSVRVHGPHPVLAEQLLPA
jgi:hypothetical protein